MKENIVIRNANKKDYDKIFEIELTSFKTPWSATSIRSAISESDLNHYKVMEVNCDVVGFYLFRSILDEAELLKIAIDRNYRGLHLGKNLLNNCIDSVKILNCNKIYLEVRKSNLVAINLYKNAGFEEISQRKIYYPDGEDAIVMKLDL